MQTANVGWINPPADVTNAIADLQHQCEAWPKTPIANPLHIVSGSEDVICRAVTGHALFVPDDIGNAILQIGTIMIAAFFFVAIALAILTGVVFRLWAKYFGPPRPPKPAPSYDVLASIVFVIGWLGWVSAAGIATQHQLVGWGTVFLLAMILWTFVAPHMVFLIRNKPTL